MDRPQTLSTSSTRSSRGAGRQPRRPAQQNLHRRPVVDNDTLLAISQVIEVAIDHRGWTVLSAQDGLYLVHALKGQEGKYPQLRGVIVDPVRRRIVANGYGHAPTVVANELHPEPDGSLALTDEHGFHHRFAPGMFTVAPEYNGVVIRIYRYQGRTYFSSYKTIDAERSRRSKDYPYFRTIYDNCGGPPMDELFALPDGTLPLESPWVYMFLLVHPCFLQATRQNVGDGYVVHLGTIRLLDAPGDDMPAELTGSTEVQLDAQDRTLYKMGQYLDIDGDIDWQKATDYLQHGLFLPHYWGDPRMDQGEALVLYSLDSTVQGTNGYPVAVVIQSFSYHWRASLWDNHTNLVHRYFILMDDAEPNHLSERDFHAKYIDYAPFDPAALLGMLETGEDVMEVLQTLPDYVAGQAKEHGLSAEETEAHQQQIRGVLDAAQALYSRRLTVFLNFLTAAPRQYQRVVAALFPLYQRELEEMQTRTLSGSSWSDSRTEQQAQQLRRKVLRQGLEIDTAVARLPGSTLYKWHKSLSGNEPTSQGDSDSSPALEDLAHPAEAMMVTYNRDVPAFSGHSPDRQSPPISPVRSRRNRPGRQSPPISPVRSRQNRRRERRSPAAHSPVTQSPTVSSSPISYSPTSTPGSSLRSSGNRATEMVPTWPPLPSLLESPLHFPAPAAAPSILTEPPVPQLDWASIVAASGTLPSTLTAGRGGRAPRRARPARTGPEIATPPGTVGQ
jgi:hypothetical protein